MDKSMIGAVVAVAAVVVVALIARRSSRPDETGVVSADAPPDGISTAGESVAQDEAEDEAEDDAGDEAEVT